MASIATKVLKGVRKARSGVIDLQSYAAGMKSAQALSDTITPPDELAKLGVSHGVYVYTQNVATTLFESLLELPELARFADVLEAAQDEYMPAGPPMSPLTTSYFTCWSFFDLAFGLRKETLGTILIAIGPEIGLHPGFVRILELMQGSRMGVYCVDGTDDHDRVILRELVLGTTTPCFVPLSYRGALGELWLARVMPPAGPNLDPVLFTTPYVLTRHDEDQWMAYFGRTLQGAKNPRVAYQALMKYGLERHYWNEYIHEAYVNYIFEAIYLAGLPDDPTTRPHSPHYVRPPGYIKAW